MVWSSILVHKLPAALWLLITLIEDKVTCVKVLRMCVNHISFNQKLTCCLHIPSFFPSLTGHLNAHNHKGTPNATYHFDWKINSKIWWSLTGGHLLSALSRTQLVESLPTLLSPDLKGKQAFLSTSCNSLHGHGTISEESRIILLIINSAAHSVWLLKLQKKACSTYVFRNKKRAENSKLITLARTFYLVPWKTKVEILEVNMF